MALPDFTYIQAREIADKAHKLGLPPAKYKALFEYAHDKMELVYRYGEASGMDNERERHG